MKINTRIKSFFKVIGPGVVTGAADDDPSGIATYTQAGAKFGYGLLWMAVFMLPLMTAVQEACARIGAVTGKGLAAVAKENYSKKILYPIVILVVIANTINIGADIGAMAEALVLLIPIDFTIATLSFTALILILEIFLPYRKYSKILKFFALSLMAYLIAIFLVDHPWGEVFRATFIPHFEFNFPFFLLIIGVLGTTISPYMFFWEASQEVEEEKAKHLIKNGHPQISPKFIRNLRLDNMVGMFFSEFTAWSIILLGATVLHYNGLTSVETAADAARALEPLVSGFPNSGLIAKGIFAVGIIGLGLLSVPVLSGSASYAVSETLNWREGLNLKFKRAHGFYGVITIATVIGLGINFIGIDPIKALIFAAIFNGIASIPLLFLIAKMASSRKIMGEYKSGFLSHFLVWLTFGLVSLAGISVIFLAF